MTWSNTKQRGMAIWIFSAIAYFCFLSVAPVSFLEKPCGDCNSLPDNVLAGKGWVNESGNFADARPPGHPLIIIGLKKLADIVSFPEADIFIFFNVFMLSFAAVLLYLIAIEVWRTNAVMVVPVAWVTCPFVAWFLNQPYSEVPFFVLFFASILSFLRSLEADEGQLFWYGVVTGALLGAAMMIRSIGIGLPVIVGISWLALSRPRPKRAHSLYLIALFLGSVMLVLPWSLIMYKETHQIRFLGPPTLTAASIANGLTFITDIDGDREKLAVAPDVAKYAENLYAQIFVSPRTRVDSDEILGQVSGLIKGVLDNPIPGISFYFLKLRRAWYGTYSHRLEFWTLLIQAGYFVLLSLSILKIHQNRLRPKYVCVLTTFVVLYFWLLAILFEPLVRYMVAPMGLLFLLFPAMNWKGRGGLYSSQNCSQKERQSCIKG